MKKAISSLLALGCLAVLPACTTVEHEPVAHTTTTTSESSVVRTPMSPVVGASTTETRTIRSY